MDDDARRVTTEAARDRLHRGRRRGGVCGACSRPLREDEAVYWEQFVVDIDRSDDPSLGRYWTTLEAPVGAECASPAFLSETAGREPGRCAGCGRGVYYRIARRRRKRLAYSWICRDRAGVAERAAKTGDGR
jgi:hypothetical protein